MRIAGFVFSPTPVPTVAYLVILTLLVSLGFWQLDRAEVKRTEMTERAAAFRAPVLDLTETTASLTSHEFRRARASGSYDSEHQFYLDNTVEDGQVGYRVLTPLRLDGRDEAVLVDRGFVAITEGREKLPTPPPVGDSAEVAGQIGRGPWVGLRLGEPSDNTGQWPRRVQYMDMQYKADALDYPLADYLLVEGSLATDAVMQDVAVRDAWRFGPERHEGYAFQWFALSATLTIIWLVVNTRRFNSNEDSAG